METPIGLETAGHKMSSQNSINISNGDFVVNAELIGELLHVDPADVAMLMRAKTITCFCERGVDVHQGEYRLNFFYKNLRARVRLDASGSVLKRSVIDFGDFALPRSLHRPGS
jgi:hypothetical protein